MSLVTKGGPIPDPPGFAPISAVLSTKKGKKAVTTASTDPAAIQDLERRRTDMANELRIKKAWEVAMAPAKSIPMQAIMLYMSGSGVQMFSMGIVWSLLTSPWGAVFNILKAFEPYKQIVPAAPGSIVKSQMRPTGVITTELLLPMLVYVACQALVLGLGIYKCSTMGLLPLGAGDWLAFETRGPVSRPQKWNRH